MPDVGGSVDLEGVCVYAYAKIIDGVKFDTIKEAIRAWDWVVQARGGAGFLEEATVKVLFDTTLAGRDPEAKKATPVTFRMI